MIRRSALRYGRACTEGFSEKRSLERMMMTLHCGDCGREFDWSEQEQEFYAGKGFTAPKRCKSCRDRRKKRRAEQEGREAGRTAVSAAKKGSRGVQAVRG